MRDVWITGVGVVSALGRGLPSHALAVAESRTGLASREFFGGATPDPVVSGMVPADILDPVLDDCASSRGNLLLKIALRDSLTDAGLTTGNSFDLVAGTTLGNMHGATCYHRQMRSGRTPDTGLVADFILSSPLETVASELGCRGALLTISSACGSATAALGEAFHRISAGHSQRVVAGGFEAMSPFIVAGFNSLRLVSKERCRPFDRDRSGLNPGEGAAMFVCEDAETARSRGARPLARIAGYGSALDAYHYTRAHPEGRGLVQAIRRALDKADIQPTDVDCLQLHGTATDANDPSEYAACRTVFGNALSSTPACSTKSMTGHTFGASGALSAAFAIVSLRDKVVPATLFHENPDPAFVGLDVRNTLRRAVNARVVMTLALGFGGEAFALVLREVV